MQTALTRTVQKNGGIALWHGNTSTGNIRMLSGSPIPNDINLTNVIVF